MMLNILVYINYTLILYFGIIVSLNFAGYEKNSKNKKAIALLALLVLFAQVFAYLLTDLYFTSKLYPFIVHFPVVIFMVFYLKRPISISLVSVLTAYLCCQPPRWLGIMFHFFWDREEAYYLGNSIGIIIMLIVINVYVANSVNNVMSYSKESLYLFGSFPLMYYIFDYATSVYTDYLYTGLKIVAEFFPSILSMFYIVFVMVYSSQMQRQNELKLNNTILKAQTELAASQISTIKEVETQTAIYRHDMRHHLALVHSLIVNNDNEKAIEYIAQVQSDIEKIVPKHYCENDVVNLLLSYFASKASQSDVSFETDCYLPSTLPISDTEISTLLSNALQNAIKAASSVVISASIPEKLVRIKCNIHKDNLLILVENSFEGKPLMAKGLPLASEEGHGYGVKSISMIVSKYKGYYSFTPKEDLFSLKIVIPLAV